MATKSGQPEPEKAEVIEELLDSLETTLDRVRVLYEQYFLGIQKQPPAYLHIEIERKIRDLAQLQIRNTALRYRFATLQQKFGSYHSYWRRTLRQIENGTYGRNLSKIGRQAARTGAAVPEEILAAMPRRMREQVLRDREAALALARLRDRQADGDEPPALPAERSPEASPDDVEIDVDDLEPAAVIRESPDLRRSLRTEAGAHRLDESDGDFDVDAFFASVFRDDPAPPPGVSGQRSAAAAPPGPAAAGTPRASPGVPAPPPAAGPQAPSERRRPTIPAPSQAAQPLRVMPGAAAARAPATVETLAGPFPRAPSAPPSASAARAAPALSQPPPLPTRRAPPPDPTSGTQRLPVVERRPAQPAPPRPEAPSERVAPPRQAPPPGMTEAEVHDLYAQYVQAKHTLGEPTGPGSYGKLLKTINAQAPKIMAQYKSSGVDFSVVVKDNQVIIRAKPKP